MELLKDADVVLDCTDNQRARYVLSDACAKLRTPLVSGASLGVEGQLVVYNERGMSDGGNDEDDVERGPCLRCAYPSPPPADECGSSRGARRIERGAGDRRDVSSVGVHSNIAIRSMPIWER